MIKTFCRCIKASLTSEIRKSIPKLAFTFGKSDFLGLVNFNFLDLAEFAIVDRFSILQPTLPLVPPPLSLADAASFLLFSVA